MNPCSLDVTRYLEKIYVANESDDCIDLVESQELFHIANDCDPQSVGSDAYQFVYQQITGIPNPERNALDQRRTTLGYLRIFFPEDSPQFLQSGFFANGENTCVNFDPLQSERDAICHPTLDEDRSDIAERMRSIPLRWCDQQADGVSYHVSARDGAESIADEKNWRVLLSKTSSQTARDIIEHNLLYADLVAHAIKLGVQAERDPWRLSDFAYDVFDILIRTRDINEAAKMEHASVLMFYLSQYFEKLPDGAYQMAFGMSLSRGEADFYQHVRTNEQLSDAWKQHYYTENSFGFWHGVFNTSLLPAAVLYAGGWLLKAGYIAVTAGAAAVAAAPVVVMVAIAVTAAAAVAWGIVEVVSWFKADEAHEEQYGRRVQRYVPPEKRIGESLRGVNAQVNEP